MKTTAYFLALLGLISFASAQPSTLSGYVTGEGTSPLSGVSVSLQSSGLTVTTNAEGAWSLDSGTVSTLPKIDGIESPKLQGNDLHFKSLTHQSIAWKIVDHSGRTVANAPTQKYATGPQRIQLPTLSTSSGIYFFKSDINGKSLTIPFLNMPQGRFERTTLPSASTALKKNAAAPDTLIFFKAGYTTAKSPVLVSVATYSMRLFKSGGVERFGYFSPLAGFKKIWTSRLDGTDAKMIPTPDKLIEEATWSPDGRRIAFTTREGIDNDFNGQIYVMNADGSQLQAFARGFYPAWHQNGDGLAWIHHTRPAAQVGLLNYKIKGEIRGAEFKDSIGYAISFQGGTGADFVVPNAHSYFEYPKWLPGTQQALIAYHKYTEFTSPNTGISRQRIYKIAQTEPYTSYSILATVKEGYVLFYPGVLFDGAIVFQRWDGLETTNRERVISNHILDGAGERNIVEEIINGLNSPNSHRVFSNGFFQDVFGGGNKVAATGHPQGIFSWFIAY